MLRLQLFVPLLLLCVLPTGVFVKCDSSISSVDNLIVSQPRLTELAGKLQAILEIEPARKDKDSEEDSWSILPPKYMIDLYHKYADERFILDTDPDRTTTIRCILGKVRRDSVHFNLSSLSDTKSISHAEVHVFRRNRRGKSPRSKFSFAQHRIRLRNLPKKFLSTIISLLPSRGWQAVDITSTVKTSLGKGKFLSMTVEASIPEFGTGRARYHTIPVDEVLRVAYRPFLVIFSSTDPMSLIVPSAETTSPSSPLLPLGVSRLDGSHNEGKDEEVRPSTKHEGEDNGEQELSTSSSNGIYPSFHNYVDSFDELENSLKSILNIDRVTTMEQNNLNNQVNKELAMENNEISEGNVMDHFHLPRSLSSSSSASQPRLLGKVPQINHSHSLSKRSIEDNEFSVSKDSQLPPFQPPRRHTRPQTDTNENSLNDADDPIISSNALLPIPSRSMGAEGRGSSPTDENEFSLPHQDNLDNGLTPSTQSQSSNEVNLNPVLPYPSRHRWWNPPSKDHSRTLSSKARGRRKGKMNRRKKLRRNRQGKKYWTTERTPLPPALPPMAAKSLAHDAQLLHTVGDENSSTKRLSSCRLEELSMDIANFDWAERIIAPAVLPLNYCHGSCSYPKNSQGLTDSSREDTESLDLDYPLVISAAPRCCAPSLKKRLVVLFADVHDNIVLRIHPNVTTQSCQCL